MKTLVKAVKNPKKAIKVALGRIVDSFVTILPDQLFIKLQFADCMLVLIDYTIIALRKRFSDYETFGVLYYDCRSDYWN